MLTGAGADTRSVLHRALIVIAVVASAFVLVSFAMFARDQLSAGSIHQQNEIALGHSPTGTPVTVKQHGQPRRFIDQTAKSLTSPFQSVVQSDSQWVLHGVPTLLGLLVYGVGLGWLARFSSGMSGRRRLSHSGPPGI